MEKTRRALYFPEEVLQEILSRLCVKSLMRFKCVCKSWCDLISTKDFTFLHLNNYKSSIFPVTVMSVSSGCLSNFMKLENSISIMESGGGQIRTIKYPPIPRDVLGSRFSHPTVSGQCNGILCLRMTMCAEDIVLWNPAIKDVRIIPTSNLPRQALQAPRRMASDGFGFDPETNDYKILKIVFDMNISHQHLQQLQQLQQLQLELYSLRTNSWKTLDASTLLGLPIGLLGPAFTSNRKIGWLECDSVLPGESTQLQMLLFDVSSETFDVIPVPVDGIIVNVRNALALPFRESIALVIAPRIQSLLAPHSEIWVLDDFCSTQPRPWRKLWTIQHQVMQRPLGFWGNRYLVFQHSQSGSFMLYDLLNQDSVDLGVAVDGIPIYSALVYKESLISISDHQHGI